MVRMGSLIVGPPFGNREVLVVDEQRRTESDYINGTTAAWSITKYLNSSQYFWESCGLYSGLIKSLKSVSVGHRACCEFMKCLSSEGHSDRCGEPRDWFV